MALLTKRSTVLGLPIGRSHPAWGKIAGIVAGLLAVVGALAAAATRGQGGEGSEGDEPSQDEGTSGDQAE